MEVKLEQMKLMDGVTVLEADSFEAGNEVFIVTEDEQKIPLPVGEYEFEDGRLLIVIEEGVISEVKETLRTWFKRKGEPGKKGGWVDCNTCREVDGKTKCKACGREKGEKRSKYPSCRPTPAQCKIPGKGNQIRKTTQRTR